MPLAVLTNKPLASTRRILDGLDLARFFPPISSSAATVRFRASPTRPGCSFSATGWALNRQTALMVGDSVIDWRTAHAAGTQRLPGALWVRLRGLSR